MTPEEACGYLDISLDAEDLDLEQIERNYEAKLSAQKDMNERVKLEEAYKYLLELYEELYGQEEADDDTDEAAENQTHEGLLMKFAVLLAVVFMLCFGGVVYFVYRLHTESSPPPKSEAVSVPLEQNENYAKILRELEELRKKQEKIQPQQIVINNSAADYSELVERVMPSMVFISTSKGTGSGFFVSPNGDILTNHHVIDGAEYITVRTQGGQVLSALVKDYNAVRDMALLKVNLSSPVQALRISPMLPKQGERVIAIGNPVGRPSGEKYVIYDNTVSNGIVSAVREFDNNVWVQFTASVSPGSSGGAVINLQCEVVGMTTWRDGAWNDPKIGTQDINFAVAPTVLSWFLASAITKPARALPQTESPKNAQRPSPRQTPQAPKSSKGSGIPLPDANGFLVHKWGCSVESIRRYVAAPLQASSVPGFYSTYKAFKAFRKRVDTFVVYGFENNRLNSVTLIVDIRGKDIFNLELDIMRELFELYKLYPDMKFGDDGTMMHIWELLDLRVVLFRNWSKNYINVMFSPR